MTDDAERRSGDRRSRRHQATQREIVSAAWRLSATHGLTGWSLRDVAEAVGMRAPSLYVYFASKAALYDALFADGYRQLEAALDDLPAPEGDLHAAALCFFDFCVREPARFQLLFLRTIPGFTPSATSYAAATDLVDRLRNALAAAGAGSPMAVDVWTAMLTGLIAQQVSNDPGGDRWRRLVGVSIDAVLHVAPPA